MRFDFTLAGLYAKRSFQHVPGFVVVMVDVTRSDQARRPGRGASVLPLGDDERIVGRSLKYFPQAVERLCAS